MRFGRRPAGADVRADVRPEERPDERAEHPDDVEDTIRLDDLPWGRSGLAVPQQAAASAGGARSGTRSEAVVPPEPGFDEPVDRPVAVAVPVPECDAADVRRADETDRADPSDETDASDQTEGNEQTEGTDASADTGDTGDTEDTAPVAVVRLTGSTAIAATTAPPSAEESETVTAEPSGETPEPGHGALAARPSTGATAARPTVAASRRRFVRRRWARRWGVWRRLVAALVVAALVLTGVWLVFFSSVLATSGVQVTGARRLSPEVVRRAAAVPLGGPLATADLDAVTARVEEIPAVRSVDVSRAWPDRVRIDVTERRPVAVVTSASGLQAVDATGVVFDHFVTRPPGLPLVRRTATTDRDALAEAAVVAASLPADLSKRVAYVSVGTVDRISLGLRSGRTVQWGSSEDSADKARVLDALLMQRATTYDVSVPGQPVIRK